MTRILFIGDIMGRSGREAVAAHLPTIKEKYAPDCVIANVDNAAHGRGVTVKTAKEITELGIDILTGGDHIWDQREMVAGVETLKNLVRPYNLPDKTPGKGAIDIKVKGLTLSVLHLGGTTFMSKSFDNPFDAADRFLAGHPLSGNRLIFIDFHAEATSEKNALAHYLDGRVSAVVGSHTHVPTCDARVLHGGTAYQTDTGMTGDYNSVIGVKTEEPIRQFRRIVPPNKMQPAEGEGTFCATLVEIGPEGFATKISPVIKGGMLSSILPDF